MAINRTVNKSALSSGNKDEWHLDLMTWTLQAAVRIVEDVESF